MMLRRRSSSEVAVMSRPGGVVLSGGHRAVERFTERLKDAAKSLDTATATTVISAVKAALDTTKRLSGDGSTLIEFSPRAMELLREHGAIPTGDGFFRSMLHDGSSFAGNLDWKPVTAGADLVSLQTAAVTLALQASIKNLADAVERVEEKVDDIRDLIRTDQVGQVLAHHRVLAPLAGSIMEGGALSSTDWDSVDDLRPLIISTVERTRLYMAKRLGAAEVGWTAQSRSSQTSKMLESEFSNTLSLLAAAEHNLASWHRVRIERVRQVEPEHLEGTVADVERELAQQRDLDQELVEALSAFLANAGTATGYEGLEPIARRRLVRRIDTIGSSVTEFARQRSLDDPALSSAEFPTLVESLSQVRDTTTSSAKSIGRWARKQSAPITAPVGSLGRRALGRSNAGDDVDPESTRELPAAED
ncbi:MAG: hypothetical protein ACJAXA_001811 [Candidatus Aldehydirespiratoraceae bacterium]|jgi:hypothetical protein